MNGTMILSVDISRSNRKKRGDEMIREEDINEAIVIVEEKWRRSYKKEEKDALYENLKTLYENREQAKKDRVSRN